MGSVVPHHLAAVVSVQAVEARMVKLAGLGPIRARGVKVPCPQDASGTELAADSTQAYVVVPPDEAALRCHEFARHDRVLYMVERSELFHIVLNRFDNEIRPSESTLAD